MRIGTKIEIIETRDGCRGAQGKIGVVTDRKSYNGLLENEPGYNVETSNGQIWRINQNAKVNILSRDDHLDTLRIPALKPFVIPDFNPWSISPYRRDPKIEKVIFNDPATIVIWSDGSKTIVKCQPGDVYSKELGLAMCISKKFLGNKGNFNDTFKKYLEEKEI